jgi:hypothetical protein
MNQLRPAPQFGKSSKAMAFAPSAGLTSLALELYKAAAAQGKFESNDRANHSRDCGHDSCASSLNFGPVIKVWSKDAHSKQDHNE